jgi:hypothetical protein
MDLVPIRRNSPIDLYFLFDTASFRPVTMPNFPAGGSESTKTPHTSVFISSKASQSV